MSATSPVNVESLRTVCIELDKTAVVLNPNFMKDILKYD